MYKKCECCGKEIIPFRGGLQSAAIRFCNSYCWKSAKSATAKKEIKPSQSSDRSR